MRRRKFGISSLVLTLFCSLVFFQNCAPRASDAGNTSGAPGPAVTTAIPGSEGQASPLRTTTPVGESGASPDGLGTISARPIVLDSPPEVFAGFALYQRNSPKYVKVGNNYFAGLNAHDAILIYKRAGESGPWTQFAKLADDYHRPPTLLVLKNNLHILFETADGLIKHSMIANAQGTNAAVATLDTSAWSNRNFYHGAAVSALDDAIYMCAAVSPLDQSSSYLKCGIYTAGTWRVKGIASYAGYAYVYPNIQPVPNGSGVWIDVGAAPYPTTSAESAATRALNLVFKLGKNLAMASSFSYGAQLKNAFFTNDIVQTPNGDIAILPTLTYQVGKTQLSGVNTVRALLLSEGWAKENFVQAKEGAAGPATVAGSCYTAMVVGDRVHLMGCGRIASSADGKQWRLSTYEIPGYPSALYQYGIAQALQNRAGSTNIQEISFIQELKHKTNGKISILEVRITRQ